MSNEHMVWTMEQDYCDNCGAYLYAGGVNDDNSGLCSFCFDQWLSEQTEEEYDPEDWYNPDEDEDVGILVYETEEWERGLPPMPAPRKKQKESPHE